MICRKFGRFPIKRETKELDEKNAATLDVEKNVEAQTKASLASIGIK